MKHFSLFAAVALSVISASCNKNTGLDNAASPKILNAITDDDVVTKTYLSGKSVIWTSEDIISAFDVNLQNHQSTGTTVTNEGKDAKFEVNTLSLDDDVVMALYPYDKNATIDSGLSITSTIPSVQNIVPDSFGNGANVAVAEGHTNDLKFRNVGAFLCLTVNNDNIRSVKLSADQKMTGDVIIDFNHGEPTVIENDSDGKAMVPYVELAGSFVRNQTYYFVVAPGTYTGLSITLTDEDGAYATLTNPTPLTLRRNENVLIGNLPFIPSDRFAHETAHEYVDLGLSVLWATCNIGASSPEDYGYYFTWAGTDNVADTGICLDWTNCPYHTGSDKESGWTKYNDLPLYGTVDNKTLLDPEDDAAHVNWGGRWRIPTQEECSELMNPDNCKWEYTRQNGVQGYRITSRKTGYTDKSIFLPAAGYRYRGKLNMAGTYGYYWTSTLYDVWSYDAIYFPFLKNPYWQYGNRCDGQSVRPVRAID